MNSERTRQTHGPDDLPSAQGDGPIAPPAGSRWPIRILALVAPVLLWFAAENQAPPPTLVFISAVGTACALALGVMVYRQGSRNFRRTDGLYIAWSAILTLFGGALTFSMLAMRDGVHF
jgi:hypothetical protein